MRRLIGALVAEADTHFRWKNTFRSQGLQQLATCILIRCQRRTWNPKPNTAAFCSPAKSSTFSGCFMKKTQLAKVKVLTSLGKMQQTRAIPNQKKIPLAAVCCSILESSQAVFEAMALPGRGIWAAGQAGQKGCPESAPPERHMGESSCYAGLSRCFHLPRCHLGTFYQATATCRVIGLITNVTNLPQTCSLHKKDWSSRTNSASGLFGIISRGGPS